MLELADIVRAVGSEERARLAVLPSQKKALQAIEQCRTPALGGQLFQCEHCRAAHYSYHSCGNRHCPKCHGQQTEVWLEQQRSRLLPCAYYLLTFTLPAELRPLAYRQQKVLYGLLLKCAVASLQKLCRDPQWLGAQPSVLGVLHTWTRAMTYHPHAHFLVSAGGWSTDGQCWLEPQNPQFLVPVRALSLIFRAKMRDALKARGLLAGVPPFWRSKKWVVHAKAAGRGEKVLEYLARYVFRIAISNSRLERFENGQVTFRYRNNRTQQIKRLSLPAAQFLARYLQHVLPKGFAKVRHYGLDSSASQPRHQQAMLLLQKLRPPAQPLAKPLLAEDATPDQDQTHRFGRCPSCRIGQLVWIAELPKKIPP
jgi:putative transposase/transposase-like zinc-binding protein